MNISSTVLRSLNIKKRAILGFVQILRFSSKKKRRKTAQVVCLLQLYTEYTVNVCWKLQLSEWHSVDQWYLNLALPTARKEGVTILVTNVLWRHTTRKDSFYLRKKNAAALKRRKWRNYLCTTQTGEWDG